MTSPSRTTVFGSGSMILPSLRIREMKTRACLGRASSSPTFRLIKFGFVTWYALTARAW